MSPKAFAVAGLSAIAIAAGGCSGGSESEAEKFRISFAESFDDAPWYHHITGMEATDAGILEITTDLAPESEFEIAAGPICGAAMGFALDHGVGDGIRGVSVRGSDGVPLGGCA